MAIPVPRRLHSLQRLVALDVASVRLASVTDQHDVPVVRVVAVVAHPVQVLLRLALVLELLLRHGEHLALEPVGPHLRAAVGTAVGIAEPAEQAVTAEVVPALQLAAVAYLVEADRALVLLQLPQLPQPLALRTALRALLLRGLVLGVVELGGVEGLVGVLGGGSGVAGGVGRGEGDGGPAGAV